MTRRSFLKASAITAGALAGGSGLAHAAPRRVRLTHHRIPWRGGARLRIAHLTDLHVGWGTPSTLLEQSVLLCQQARPDLVVLTGDYVNRTLKHLPELSALLGRLPRPCVATLGNHDHWAGAEEITAALGAQGIPVLQNEHLRLIVAGTPVTVVGIDDGFTGRDDVERAFAGLRCPEAALVLSHFPEAADAIASCGGRIVLAGHTHGGQIELPIVTTAVARLAGSRYIAGWYDLGCARLYVNAGVGSAAIRVRLGANTRPEVAVVDLLPEARRRSR
jgi:predicted MPP superfamily phosphohydrolase